MKRSALRQRLERRFVGDAAPQPGGNGFLLDLLQTRGDAGFAEIFLRQHVGGDLRPLLRHFDVFGVEDDRTVRIADFARGAGGKRCPRRAIVLLWCSADRSAFSAPWSLSALYRWPSGYPLNIGHRRFPRDAAERTPPRRLTPVSVCHPRRPAAKPGLVLYVRASRKGDDWRTKPRSRHWRRGAVPQTLFGEPGRLHYPRAELDEARPSRSRPSRLSMKMLNQPLNVGIAGKNRCGDAQVSEIRRESERA